MCTLGLDARQMDLQLKAHAVTDWISCQMSLILPLRRFELSEHSMRTDFHWHPRQPRQNRWILALLLRRCLHGSKTWTATAEEHFSAC